ncbi:hypothetical protein OZX72_08925 [Bifidobacterium sp. ESL0769]|uniref:hypothetical protein n=1 Tax=Bifidobacterium sp. ESL0769 TaxID=2983229 RepID=UPI0023F7DD27|nr:hypothetical protein [Bifidobacterium sp. ESL0769]WEV67339.1 hypothetical protein OZX72_08925 [Bifidobacterium sp. ESL0769]
MTTRNDFNKQGNVTSKQSDFAGNHNDFHNDFTLRRNGVTDRQIAGKRDNSEIKSGGFAVERDNAASKGDSRPAKRGVFARKHKDFASSYKFVDSTKSSANKQGLLSRLGSWKRIAVLAFVFIWVALACFATFKAFNTTTIVTENPQTVSATYEQKQPDADKPATAVPAVDSASVTV